MNASNGQPPSPTRTETHIKLAFGALALVSVLTGLALHLFGERLGLEPSTGRLIATAFIVAGVLDAGVLYLWDRLFARRG